MTTLTFTSERRIEARDVTAAVAATADSHHGVLWLSSPHTTVALVVNEADTDLLEDLERLAAELLSPLEPFTHARCGNPNASAHFVAALLGRECLIAVENGQLSLGTHQRVLLIELDGPKQRRLEIRSLGSFREEVA
jgi:secondary thiamine-phosphate synthase enzyme